MGAPIITSQCFTLPPDFTLTDNSIKIPIELIMACLFTVDLKALLRFSITSKDSYFISADPRLWKNLAQRLSIAIALPHSKETFKIGYSTQKSYESLRDRLLKERLPVEVCETIDALPFWAEKIVFNDDEKEDLPLSQFPLHKNNDQKNHFFKALMDGDLYLILIKSDRYYSKVIRFNGAFSTSSGNLLEFIWWTHSLPAFNSFFIKTAEAEEKKQRDLINGWGLMRRDIVKDLELGKED